jgi:hypothetical protein
LFKTSLHNNGVRLLINKCLVYKKTIQKPKYKMQHEACKRRAAAQSTQEEHINMLLTVPLVLVKIQECPSQTGVEVEMERMAAILAVTRVGAILGAARVAIRVVEPQEAMLAAMLEVGQREVW